MACKAPPLFLGCRSAKNWTCSIPWQPGECWVQAAPGKTRNPARMSRGGSTTEGVPLPAQDLGPKAVLCSLSHSFLHSEAISSEQRTVEPQRSEYQEARAKKVGGPHCDGRRSQVQVDPVYPQCSWWGERGRLRMKCLHPR